MPLTTSPAQPTQSCVTSPTSFARWRAIADTGSVATVTATDSAGGHRGAGAATGRRNGPPRRRRTTHTSSPISITRLAP